MICIPNTPEIDELRSQYNKKYKDNMTEHQFIALLEAMMSRYNAKSIPDNLSAINSYYKEQRQKDAEMGRLIKQPKYHEQGFRPAQSPSNNQSLYAQEHNMEMEEIKQRAIADGTFMKAPNGKKSNLNERQWLQVRTKAFKKWFGDWENDPENSSKVVDENGEPLVVYHHTDNPKLTEFSIDYDNYFSTKKGGTKAAIFFDENKTGTLDRKYDVPVFLNIRDLRTYTGTKEDLHKTGTSYTQVVNESAKSSPTVGGLHMADFDDNKLEHQDVWIVHNPNQIKSATDNVGTFSTEEDNIFYSLVPEEARQIASTIAPYRKTTYADYTHMIPEERNKMRNAFATAAKNIADLLGIELDMSTASANIGGYQFDGGGEIVEPSFTFRMNTTPEKARMFSALMADLGWEQQESVATFMSVDNPEDGNGVRFTIKFSERLLPLLEKHGIKNFTFDKQNEVLSVLSFDEADVQKLYNLTEELNNGQAEKQEVGTAPFFSTLDFEEDRRALYEEWLRREGGQDPVLDNLVKEALRKVTPQQQSAATDNNQPSAPVNTDTPVQQEPVQETASVTDELEAIMKAQASAMRREDNNEMLNLTQEMADEFSEQEIRTMVDYVANMVMRYMDKSARDIRSRLLQEITNPAKSEDDIARLKAQIARLSDRADKYSEIFKQGVTPIDIISDVLKELSKAQRGDSFYDSTIGSMGANNMIYYFDPLLRSAFLVINRRTGIEFSINRDAIEGELVDALSERIKAEEAAPTEEQLKNLVELFSGTAVGGVAMQEENVDEDHTEEANEDSEAPFFDVRKENPYKSLSPAIRMLLSNVAANEQDGFKQQRTLDPEFVYAAIMDLLSKEVNSPDDFYTMVEITEDDPDYKRKHMFPDGKKPVFHALEKYRYKYRWMPALIKTLTNDFVCTRDMQAINDKLKGAGIDAMEIQYGRTVSMLYNTRREFVPFTTLSADGNLLQINELTSNESIENVVLANYNSRTMLTRTMIYDKDGKVNLDNVKKLLENLKGISGYLGTDEANNDFLNIVVRVNKAFATEYGELLDDISHYWALDDEAKARIDAKEKAFNAKRIELAQKLLKERFGDEWGHEGRVEIFESLIAFTNTLRSLGFDVREEDVFQGTNSKGVSRVSTVGLTKVKSILTRISSPEFLNSGVENIFAGTDDKLWKSWRELYEQMNGVVYASQHSTSTREHGEERYSFMPANEITRQWKELTHMDVERRRAYIAEKWGNNPFFRDQSKVLKNSDGVWNVSDAGWRNVYLQLQWEDDPRFRLTGDMKADIIANGDKEFEDWNSTDITEIQLALYAKGINNATGDKNNALYMLPIFADSPVCKALGGRRYTIDQIVDNMTEVAMQEVDRIQGVAKENALRDFAKKYLAAKKKGKTLDFKSLSPSLQDIALVYSPDMEGLTQQEKDNRLAVLNKAAAHNPIANLAKRGLEFQFIPELNDQVYQVAGGVSMTVLDMVHSGTMTPSEIRDMLHEEVDKVLAKKYNDYFAQHHTVYDKATQQAVNQKAILYAATMREFYQANPNIEGAGHDYVRLDERGNVMIYVEDGSAFWRSNPNGGGRMVISRGEWFYLSPSDRDYLEKLSHGELSMSKEEDRLKDFRVPLSGGKLGSIAAVNAKGWSVDRLMRDMWYNSTFANSQVIQIMFGDVAFAKDFDDFQKRWKALYAGGIQLDTNCIGGRKEYNMVILKDNKRAISSSYDNIYKSFDKAVQEGRITEVQRDKWCSAYHKIDATDAQGLRSLESFRRVLKMASKWTTEAEQSYQRIINGKWTEQDLNFMVQTIKPVYFGTNEQTLPGGMQVQVPMYIKNSEAVLMTLFRAIQMPYSPTLRALDRVQRSIKYTEGPNAGQTYIDAYQYETAVKLGGQGAVDLRYSRKRLDQLRTEEGWADMKEALTSFMNWRNSLKDFEGDASDLSTITYDELADWAHKMLDKAKGRDAVGSVLKMVNGVLNFLDYSRKEDKNLQRQWEDEMVDILNGTIYSDPNSDEINPEVVHQLDNNNMVIQQPTPHHPVDGKVSFGSQLRYLMPIDLPDDMTVTVNGKKYNKTQLIEHYNRLMVARALKGYEEANSVFADIHTLQKYLVNIVKGNPRYGDDMLNALEIVEWTDEQGQKHETFALPNTSINMANKLEELLTAVYRNKVHKQKMHGGSTILMADMKYSDELEVRFKDGHLEGVECLLPAAAKGIIQTCGKLNRNGEYVIDPSKLSDEDLDKIVGYRIPTDDKHSMLPLIVKGFLPPSMGSALVVSKEIITMTGGDNDVDKLYLFTHHYNIHKGRMVKIQYDQDVSENQNSLAQIENEIIDVCYQILTSDKVSDKLFKPQDYEEVRDTAMMIQVINNPQANAYARQTFAERYGKDKEIDFLKLDADILKDAYDLTKRDRSPIYPETYTYYHNQNSSGKAEVGIFANNSALNAKLQDKGIMVKDQYVITVNGREIRELSPMFIYAEGKKMRVSDNCSELLGAAADTAKDPLLARMGITKANAAFAGFLVRMGLTLKETGMLISIYKKHGIPKGFGKIITQLKKGGWEPQPINTKMLEKVLSTPSYEFDPMKTEALNVLYAIYTFKNLAYSLREVTIGMQADSPNHAIETDFASAIYYKYASERANTLIRDASFPFDFPKDEHGEFVDIVPVNGSDSFDAIMSSKAPVTQAYHTLGISKALDHISQRSITSDPAFDDWMRRLGPYLWSMKKDDAIRCIRALYREYVTFYLSRLPMFDEFKGADGQFLLNRQYFKYYFPLKFKQWVDKSGVKNNIALSRIEVDLDNKLTINQESLSEMTVPYIFAGLDSLWQETDSGFGDDTTMRCARALMIYSYFANGLTFSFGDISNFFSVSYLSRDGHFDEYISALAELEQKAIEAHKTGKSQLTPVESDRFFTQFVRNNGSRFGLGIEITNDPMSGIPHKQLKDRINANLKETGLAYYELSPDEENRFTEGLFYKVPVQDPSKANDPFASLFGGKTYYKYDIYECRSDNGDKILVKIADGLENDKWYHYSLNVDDMNKKEEWYHPGVKADTWDRPVTTRQLRKAEQEKKKAEGKQRLDEMMARSRAAANANDTTSNIPASVDNTPSNPETSSMGIDFSNIDDDNRQLTTADAQAIARGLNDDNGMPVIDNSVFARLDQEAAERAESSQSIDGIDVDKAINAGESKMDNPNPC